MTAASGSDAMTMSQRAGATVVEVSGSHAVFISQPAVVANLIVQAAREAMAHAG